MFCCDCICVWVCVFCMCASVLQSMCVCYMEGGVSLAKNRLT